MIFKQEPECHSISASTELTLPDLGWEPSGQFALRMSFKRQNWTSKPRHFRSTSKIEGSGRRCCSPDSVLTTPTHLDRERCGLGKKRHQRQSQYKPCKLTINETQREAALTPGFFKLSLHGEPKILSPPIQFWIQSCENKGLNFQFKSLENSCASVVWLPQSTKGEGQRQGSFSSEAAVVPQPGYSRWPKDKVLVGYREMTAEVLMQSAKQPVQQGFS